MGAGWARTFAWMHARISPVGSLIMASAQWSVTVMLLMTTSSRPIFLRAGPLITEAIVLCVAASSGVPPRGSKEGRSMSLRRRCQAAD